MSTRHGRDYGTGAIASTVGSKLKDAADGVDSNLYPARKRSEKIPRSVEMTLSKRRVMSCEYARSSE